MHTIPRRRRVRRYRALRESMADARRGEVVFVSHSLLNQNTRYLGGGVCPGVVAATIAPYVTNGTGIVQLSVVGVVGVAGSPTCGVRTTVDLKRAAAALACRGREPATAAWMNSTVVHPALCPGRGMFVEELDRAMERHDVAVPMLEEQLAVGDPDGGCEQAGGSLG